MAQTDFLYNLRSQVTEVHAPLGRKSFRTYDKFGRLRTVHDNLSTDPAEWNEVELQYVPGRDLVQTSITKLFEESDDASPPSGTRKDYATDFVRDTLGRVIETRRKGLVGGSQAALKTTYAYNSLGMMTFLQEPDQQGSADKYSRTTFDAFGRWVEFVKSASPTDKIRLTGEFVEQDGAGTTEVKRLDGRGFVTRAVYDAAYRLTDLYRPGYTTGPAHHTHLDYDVASRLQTATDGNGSVITYQYDIASRLLSRAVVPGGGVSYLATKEIYAYDGIGRLSHLQTNMSATQDQVMVTVDLTRDSLGRLLQESFGYTGVTGSFGVQSGYAFTGGGTVGDPGFRRSLTYPGGFSIATVPDAVGRLDQVKLTVPGSAQFDLASYRYAAGQVVHKTTTLGSGDPTVDTDLDFDAYRRVSLLQHQKAGDPSPLSKFELTWDDGDRLVRRKHTRVDGSAGDLFAYDDFDRLVGAKLGVPQTDIDGSYGAAASAVEIAYALDPGQNRSSVTVTLSGQNPQTTPYTTEADSLRYAVAPASGQRPGSQRWAPGNRAKGSPREQPASPVALHVPRPTRCEQPRCEPGVPHSRTAELSLRSRKRSQNRRCCRARRDPVELLS